jgi:hypothetical protein
MALTKTSTTLTWASGSSTSSGTTVAISTTGAYAATMYVKLATGVGVTVAPTFYLQQSPDGSTYYNGPIYATPIVASTSYYFMIALDPGCESVQLVYTQETTGTSTLTGQLAQVTGV